MASAFDRVKAALADKSHSSFLPAPENAASEVHQYVELDAADIISLTTAAKKMPFDDFVKTAFKLDPAKLNDKQRAAATQSHEADGRTQIVRDLHKGSTPHYQHSNQQRRMVWIKVDDALHLIGQQPPVVAKTEIAGVRSGEEETA